MKNLLIINSSVFNGQAFLPGHYSILVQNGRILKISPLNISKPDSSTTVINAGGNTVMPALHDGHCHFMATAWQKHSLDLNGIFTLPEAKKKMQKYSEKLASGEWVRGGGWSLQSWGQSNIHKKHLDKWFPNRPVALESKDFHSVWINSAAQKILKIPKSPQNTEHAVYGRDENGAFNGVLYEKARNIVYTNIPDPSLKWINEALNTSIPQWWKNGFTACTGMEMKKDIFYLKEYFKRDGYPFKLTWFAPYTMLNELQNKNIISGNNYKGIRFGGIKLFADGSFGSRSAEVTKPYKNSNNYGVPLMPQWQIEEIVEKAHSLQMATAIHAIGDKAIDRVLAAYEKSFTKNPGALKLRNRLEHVQLPSLNAIELMSQRQLGIAIQPIHIQEDIDIIKDHLPNRKEECYPLKTFQNKKIPLIMSSDAPVADTHPWRTIYMAITQKDPDDFTRQLNTVQSLSLIEALKAYTSTAAYFAYRDDSGKIEENVPADIIILNKNLKKINEPEEILDVKNKTVILDGRIVYHN